MELQAVHERVQKSVVKILIGNDEGLVEVGTGVLVRVGGAEFVLTAAHNVWDRVRGENISLSVHAPPPNLATVTRLPDGSISGIVHRPPLASGDVEPDVAVIKLSQNALLRGDRQPFGEDELGFVGPDAPSRPMILYGFPAAPTHTRVTEQKELGGANLIESTPIAINVPSLPTRRAEQEPGEGRGVHVFIGARGREDRTGVDRDLPKPEGMSGGPLIVPEGHGILVGLVRSRVSYEGGHDVWCEPIVEALRLLACDESPAVVDAAAKVVARLDALARTTT